MTTTQSKLAKDLPSDLIDERLKGYQKSEDLIGENGLLKQLTKKLVERALQAEMTEHLGYDKHEAVMNATGNARNGKSTKTLKGEFGELPIKIPRDRDGSFEPQLIPKHQTRWTGFDDKIISLYARGMTVREIQHHLGHDKHEAVINATGNARNGKSSKTLNGEFGELPIEIPRDRDGSFEPQLIPKQQTLLDWI